MRNKANTGPTQSTLERKLGISYEVASVLRYMMVGKLDPRLLNMSNTHGFNTVHETLIVAARLLFNKGVGCLIRGNHCVDGEWLNKAYLFVWPTSINQQTLMFHVTDRHYVIDSPARLIEHASKDTRGRQLSFLVEPAYVKYD